MEQMEKRRHSEDKGVRVRSKYGYGDGSSGENLRGDIYRSRSYNMDQEGDKVELTGAKRIADQSNLGRL